MLPGQMQVAPIEDDTSEACDAQRVKFDLKFLFLAMTLSALWLAMFGITTIASKLLLAVFALTFLFGCWKTRRAVLFLLPALYLPYLVHFTIANWKWNRHSMSWLRMLWQLPGMIPDMLRIRPHDQPWFDIVTSALTLVTFFVAVMLARPSLARAKMISLIVLLLSFLNSMLGPAFFR